MLTDGSAPTAIPSEHFACSKTQIYTLRKHLRVRLATWGRKPQDVEVLVYNGSKLEQMMGVTGDQENDSAGLGVNLPEVVEELTREFHRYEQALMSNRPDELAALFWSDPRALRYGVAEILYGYDEIAQYRRVRARQGGAPPRTLVRTVITTFGRDFGTANTEYLRKGSGRVGRQSQTWVRMPEGWCIVSAHVSLLQEEDR